MVLMTALLLAILTLCGCQPNPHSSPSNVNVALHIRLPAAIAPNTTRYKRFLTRVLHMTVKVDTAYGFKQALQFTPSQWDKIHLVGIDFPKTAQDSLRIRIEVWDKNRSNLIRPYPVLVGKARLLAADFEIDRVNRTIPVHLEMAVQPADYD
ncbi:MAG: hypothetical protein HY537_10870 [Deltaproteobacteria bacterium]|nr:hypothetical protein [Deltaproteobacteria bacterium]